MNRTLRTLLVLLALVAFLVLPACGTGSGRLNDDDDDDDDSAAGHDDDDTPADDDDTPADDDDTPPDDDDSAGDDDDSTLGPPPDDPVGMVDRTYCLDWNTVTVTQPNNLFGILNILGISVTEYPLLLSPTAVNPALGQVWMLVTGALQGTCDQDLTIPTVDLTAAQPGTYTPPLFAVGPGDFSTTIDGFQLTIYGLRIAGQFSQDNSQVYDGRVTGLFDVTVYAQTACALLACVPCPNAPSNSCLNFAAQDAVFTDMGNGPLTVVP